MPLSTLAREKLVMKPVSSGPTTGIIAAPAPTGIKYTFDTLSSEFEPPSTPEPLQARDKGQILLTTLVLLGSRLNAELEEPRDALFRGLRPHERIMVLLASAILEDSRLLTPSAPRSLERVVHGHPISIRGSTFRDRDRMLMILRAVDPTGTFWGDLIDCSEEEWELHGDCEKLVRRTLSELGIAYSLSKTQFVEIEVPEFLDTLVHSYVLASAVMDRATTDLLFETIFGVSTLEAMKEIPHAAALDNHATRNPGPFWARNEDVKAGVKLLIMSVSVFFASGLLLGHTLAGRSAI